MTAGLKSVIFLSFVLALGFLLVILACALWSNWLPLVVAATFLLAPVPNSLCARIGGGDDFSGDSNPAIKDFSSFLTAMLVSSAFALPLIFAHTGLIAPAACWMSLTGGALVYGTILVFTGVFAPSEDDY